MSNTIDFHRLEQYSFNRTSDNPNKQFTQVIVSFKTRQHGIFQIKCNNGGISQLLNEPDFYMFTQKEQRYIKLIAHTVYKIINEYPARKDRFE